MGELDLSVAVAHVATMDPHLKDLISMHNSFNNTSTTRWTHHLYILRSDIMVALLRTHASTLWRHHIASSIIYHPKAQNHLSKNASQRWDITNSSLLDILH